MRMIFSSFGFSAVLFIVSAAIFSFVATLLTLRNGKGPFRASALMLTVALPFVIALFFEFINSSSFFSYAAAAPGSIKGVEVYRYFAHLCWRSAFVMFLTAPTYLLAIVGTLRKCLRKQAEATSAAA